MAVVYNGSQPNVSDNTNNNNANGQGTVVAQGDSGSAPANNGSNSSVPAAGSGPNGSSSGSGASGSSINSVGAGTQQAPSQQKASSSGSFANIQNYLNANQNSGIGQQVENKIQGVGNQATNQLNQTENQFNQQAQAAKPVDYNAQTFNALGSAKDASSIGQAVQNAQSQLNSNYAGPNQLGNQTNLTGQQQQLQGLASNTQNSGGRAALLSRFFDNPNYQQGQQNLDTLLLGGQNQQGALQQSRQVANQYSNNLNSGLQSAAQTAQNYHQQAQQTQQEAQQGLAGSNTAQTQSLQDQINAFNQSEQARNADRFNAAVNKATADSNIETMAKGLGISDQQLLDAAGQYNANTATLSNVNPQQAAVLNAIYGLQGNAPLNIQQQVTAGSYGLNNAALTDKLSPIYQEAQNKGVGGYGNISATLGDTSQLLGAGYDPTKLSQFLNAKSQEENPYNQVWGGYGRSGDDAINDLVNWENNTRNRAKSQAINSALNSLYAQSGYKPPGTSS